MRLIPTQILDAFLNYPEHRVYPSLWDSSLACALGPLCPEGATLRDYSGRTAGAAWSVGAGDTPEYAQGSVKGQAFHFAIYDGTDDKAVIGDLASLEFVGSPFSVSCWFNVAAADQARYQNFIAKNNATLGWMIGMYSRKVFLQIKGAYTNAGNAVPLDNGWHHVCGTFDGSNMRIYLDGVLGQTVGATPGPTTNSDPANIGGVDAGSSYFRGSMASHFAHGRVLTTNEIATLALGPLEAYRVNVPQYYDFPSSPTTAPWLWTVQQHLIVSM